jgi:hypothetical protein
MVKPIPPATALTHASAADVRESRAVRPESVRAKKTHDANMRGPQGGGRGESVRRAKKNRAGAHQSVKNRKQASMAAARV